MESIQKSTDIIHFHINNRPVQNSAGNKTIIITNINCDAIIIIIITNVSFDYSHLWLQQLLLRQERDRRGGGGGGGRCYATNIIIIIIFHDRFSNVEGPIARVNYN